MSNNTLKEQDYVLMKEGYYAGKVGQIIMLTSDMRIHVNIGSSPQINKWPFTAVTKIENVIKISPEDNPELFI